MPGKRKGGKPKGNRVELQLVKLLQARFGEGFSRSVGSGNRWSQVETMPTHAQQVFAGDLVVPTDFLWVIESKGGYSDVDLNSVLKKGSSQINEFVAQVSADSTRCQRKPVLFWKRDYKPWLCLVRQSDLPIDPERYLRYDADWLICDAEWFLSQPDVVFFRRLEGTNS